MPALIWGLGSGTSSKPSRVGEPGNFTLNRGIRAVLTLALGRRLLVLMRILVSLSASATADSLQIDLGCHALNHCEPNTWPHSSYRRDVSDVDGSRACSPLSADGVGAAVPPDTWFNQQVGIGDCAVDWPRYRRARR